MRAASVACAFGLVALAFACSAAPPDGPSLGGSKPRPSASTDDGNTPPPPVIKEADAGTSAQCVTAAPNHRCGLDPQCGCGANETCDITTEATGATSCVSGGSGTLGRPCTQTGECVAGLTCAFGACRPYCTTPRTKCNAPGTELCTDVVDDNGKPMPNAFVCSINCDPFDPKGVCGTNSCHWFATFYGTFKISDCNFPGPQTLYKTCELDLDCAAGLVCIDHPAPDLGKHCEKWCRVGVAGDCPAGFTCMDVFAANAPVVNGVKRGVCFDP